LNATRNIEAPSYNRCCCGKAKMWYVLWVCVCSISCPWQYGACNANAPYCHLWPAPLYSTFPHYPI